MTTTRNYPKVRTVDPPEPEYLYGPWEVRHTPAFEALVRERSVYRSAEIEPIAVEKRVDFERTNSYIEVCTFTRAYMKARKARMQSTTPEAVSEPQEGVQ